MLSVQDTAGAVEQVKAIFAPYVEGLAQIVQQQVTSLARLVCHAILGDCVTPFLPSPTT